MVSILFNLETTPYKIKVSLSFVTTLNLNFKHKTLTAFKLWNLPLGNLDPRT
jgi:hypothetical protein